jgi:hypothetical protein
LKRAPGGNSFTLNTARSIFSVQRCGGIRLL